MTNASKLAGYLMPTLTEERVAAQWAGSLAVARVRRRKRILERTIAGSVACVAMVAGLLLIRVAFPPAPAPSWTGAGTIVESAVVESGQHESQRITLPDQTRIELDVQSRVVFLAMDAEQTRIRLERGAVTLDVPHRPGHRLSVEAGTQEVTVIGTRFRVELGTERRVPTVSVSVERGRVRVRPLAGGEAREVVAGESWAQNPSATAPSATTEVAGTLLSPPRPSAPASSITAPPATADWRTLRRSNPRVAYETLGAAGFASAVSTAGPSDLFALYELAVLNGRPREAASALVALRERYPADARAGLAAFELGRLRQDQLGDAAGAAQAFEAALRQGGTFSEDASARLVRAYQSLGGGSRCVRARKAYLARYPRGPHAEVVRRQCD